MKYIITENQTDKFLSNYAKRLSTYPEYNWVDRVEMNKTTVRRGGWSREVYKPLYEYNVFFKEDWSPSGKDKDKIIDEISKIHATFFDNKNSEPEAYYGVNFYSV